MPQSRRRLVLLACLMLGPAAVAQDATQPTADPPAPTGEAQADEPTPATPPEQAPREVTIGQPAPGTTPGTDPGSDPLADRDRPGASPRLPREGAQDEPMVLGVSESEIRIDPRTLGIAPGDPLPPLLREGEFIRNRDARLIPTGERGVAVVILEPPADAGPDAKPTAMIVAPNRMLESMESLHKDRGDNLRFTLTGQVHTYRGVNYLLITSQPRPWLIGHAPVAPQPSELADAADQPADADADADITDATPNDADESSSDDVLNQLLGERTQAPETLEPRKREDPVANPPAIDPRPLVQGIAPDQPEPKLYEEGAFIINRTARLVRSGDGAHPVLIFDADAAASPEPPMIVQNCKLLEEMEAIVETHGDHVPFVITGQIQTYRGTNYILPSIGKLEFERNNLE